MEICKHHIADSEIIGIGPLMVEGTTDQLDAQLYGTVRMAFSVHVKQQSIKIQSDMVQRMNVAEDFLKKNTDYLNGFKAEYYTAKDIILASIRQMPISNEYKTDNDE